MFQSLGATSSDREAEMSTKTSLQERSIPRRQHPGLLAVGDANGDELRAAGHVRQGRARLGIVSFPIHLEDHRESHGLGNAPQIDTPAAVAQLPAGLAEMTVVEDHHR